MNLAAYSFGIAGLAYSVFAAVLVRNSLPRVSASPGRYAFLFAVFATVAWSSAGFVSLLVEPPAWTSASRLFDLARYVAWITFLTAVLRSGKAIPRRLLWGVGATLLLVGGGLLANFDRSGSNAVARYLPFVSLAFPVGGIMLIEQIFRNVLEDARWHAKPLCLGLSCIFLFDAYLNSYVLLFGNFDRDLLAIRPVVHALAVPLLFIALKRQSDWTGEIRLSRNAAFHTATLMLVGIYLLGVSAVSFYVRDFGGDLGRALQLAMFCVALLLLSLLIFSGAVRARVRVFIGKNFFRYRYDYRTEWLRYTAMLSASKSPREVAERVIRGLAEMVRSPSGGLWALDPRGAEFVQMSHWNSASSLEREAADSSLAKFLVAREWIIDLDEYRARPERYEDCKLPSWLQMNPQQWLLVPLIAGDQLIGFATLGRPHLPSQVNWEMRDLLKTAGRQAGSFLAQMQATEALLEVRKFDAFNRMSAFVVHDLKNVVAQLSLMAQNAKRLKDNPEFQQDMVATVESSLEKMRRLMLQLREGDTHAGVASGVELLPIVKRLQASASQQGRAIQLDIQDSVVTRGHGERIERVLGHVVQNALDATDASGALTLTLARIGSHAKVVVSDTGHGMSAEFVNSRLFKPFNSTKANGMGLGAYESFQYVRELGGTIQVDSEIGRGTVVTLLLPLFDSKQVSDLEMASAL